MQMNKIPLTTKIEKSVTHAIQLKMHEQMKKALK